MRRFIDPTILALCIMALAPCMCVQADSFARGAAHSDVRILPGEADQAQALCAGLEISTSQGGSYSEDTFSLGDVLMVPEAGAGTKIDYAQVAEDIDVMARIIDKTLEGKFTDEYKASSLFSGSRGCQGIYLKGYGFVFMTSIGFPVTERAKPEEKAAPDDLWQRTKYELRGLKSETYNYLSVGDSEKKYDPKKVEQLKEELLRLVGTYALNIRQLGPQENVVIAVRGAPEMSFFQLQYGEPLKLPQQIRLKKAVPFEPQSDEPTSSGTSSLRRWSEVTGSSQPPEPRAASVQTPTVRTSNQVIVTRKAGDKEVTEIVPVATATWDTRYVSERGARGRTTLMIKVNKKGIAAYKDGGLDFDKFTKQAEITQY
jgi:hypothetical protein